jgi:hypothetical protein
MLFYITRVMNIDAYYNSFAHSNLLYFNNGFDCILNWYEENKICSIVSHILQLN